jgi:hypothetical protein
MKKLMLKIAELAVESFSIAERKERGGTVRAHVFDTVYQDGYAATNPSSPCDCMITYPGDDRC